MLSFEKRDEESALSKQYGVRGIPSLVLLNPDGAVLTKDGRDAIMNAEFLEIKDYAANKEAEERIFNDKLAQMKATPLSEFDFLAYAKENSEDFKIYNTAGELIHLEDVFQGDTKGEVKTKVLGIYFSAHVSCVK